MREIEVSQLCTVCTQSSGAQLVDVRSASELDQFKVEVDVPAAVDEGHRKGVEEAVHHCLIHNTLQHPPTITLVVRPVAVAAN